MEQGTTDTGQLMLTGVRFETAQGSFDGALSDTAITRALRAALPITSQVNRWGDEIYFDVPVKLVNSKPTRAVKLGDIAYWPDGPCLCIFFGKTPASLGSEPRPASEVTVIGQTEAPGALLRTITEGTTLRMSHAPSTSLTSCRPRPEGTRPEGVQHSVRGRAMVSE